MSPPTTELVIRNARLDDVIPTYLLSDLAILVIDPEWMWVAEQEGQIVGVLLAGPVHGVVFLMRIKASDAAPRTWLLKMLRKVLKDCQARGYFGAMTYVRNTPSEAQLLRIALREGWIIDPDWGVWAAGSTEVKH